MASLSTSFTVCVIEEKRSVRLPTRECRTDSESFVATSAATFLDISAILKFARMGSKSSSPSTAPPVRFFTPRVRDLKRPFTRPGLSGAFSFSCSSSASEPDDSDSTSSSPFSQTASSPESPRNVAFCLMRASASSSPSSLPFRILAFEKSRSCMDLLVTLPSSQCRFSLPFLLLSSSMGASSSSFSAAALPRLPAAPVPLRLASSLARAAATFALPPSSSSPSSSESTSPLVLLLASLIGGPLSTLFF
mmetsp:Transcript_39811/g.127562  ORF Transcript_39811/g.127562 Transcript_39811/m.127562 type:complete len:249 (-) Transcript_39811:515-1261(-)